MIAGTKLDDVDSPATRRYKDLQNAGELTEVVSAHGETQMKKVSESDDPLLRCVPYGMPRAVLSSPWPFQIVQAPGVAVMMTEYYHAYRVIPTDGTPHIEGMYPTHFGDSVARWEGDTLVVDVVAFNGKTWLSDRDKPSPTSPGNWPTSDAMHQIERWRR